MKVLMIEGVFYRPEHTAEDGVDACDKCTFAGKSEQWCNRLMNLLPDESSCCNFDTYYQTLSVEDLAKTTDEQLEKARSSEIHTKTY